MKTCYAIIRIRSFHGAKTKISLVTDDAGSQYFSFSSPEEARALIRKLAGKKSFLTQNESNPPAYAVAKVGSRKFHDAYRSTWCVDPENLCKMPRRQRGFLTVKERKLLEGNLTTSAKAWLSAPARFSRCRTPRATCALRWSAASLLGEGSCQRSSNKNDRQK